MIKWMLMVLVALTQAITAPFDYDLHLSTLPGKNNRVMICCHGYGDNHEIATRLKKIKYIEATLVSFNFPDYSIPHRKLSKAMTFGTIDELLPAFYVLKQQVLDRGLDSIDFYGFSAGGGVVINVLGALNTSIYDAELKKIGIDKPEKAKLLAAIQKGIVILDAPLKSVEEIIDFRGGVKELEAVAQNYRKNDLRPIDSLRRLKGLSLNILLHFQVKDEILSNRDDQLYIERLKAVQPKTSTIIIGDDGGHNAPHLSLWKAYAQKFVSP